jgi:hypothetical protein
MGRFNPAERRIEAIWKAWHVDRRAKLADTARRLQLKREVVAALTMIRALNGSASSTSERCP